MATHETQSTFERVFLSVAVVLLIASLYLLTDDSLLFGSKGWGNRPVVGKVTFLENDVRRKGSDDFQWSNTASDDEVYEGDSVFTGNFSKAIVTLKDGSIIEINANSLVVFNTRDDKIDLDLKFGDFMGEFQASTQINIQDDDEDVSVSSNGSDSETTSLKISRNRRGESAIKLLSGEATLTGADGEKSLSSDESLLLNSENDPGSNGQELAAGFKDQLLSDPLELVSPTNNEVFWSNSDSPIDFTWSTAGLFGEFEIELSRKPDFSEIAYRASSLSKDFRLKRYPAAAQLFWRVNAYDSKGQLAVTSEPAAFQIRQFKPLQITSPASGSSIFIPMEKLPATTDVKVSWTDDNQIGSYFVELAKDSEFSEVIASTLIESKQWTTGELTPGRYYLRLRPHSDDAFLQSLWTEPVTFSIQRGQEKNLARDLAQFGPSTVEPPPLSAPAPRPPRVVPSPSSTITVTHPARFGNDEGPEKEVPLTWEELETAASYEVEYSDMRDFSRKRVVHSENNEADITLPKAGTYYWRVRGLNQNEKPIGDFSKATLINYWVIGRESLPAIREPANNTNYFRRSDGTVLVWLQWTQVKYAEKYEVEVSTDEDFENSESAGVPVYRYESTEPRYLLRQDLKPERYYWRVRAYINKTPAQWTQPQNFIIRGDG